MRIDPICTTAATRVPTTSAMSLNSFSVISNGVRLRKVRL
jgi:hypothetical protein